MKFAEHLGAHITPEWRKQCKFHNLWFHELTNLSNCKKWKPKLVDSKIRENDVTSFLIYVFMNLRIHESPKLQKKSY